MHPVFLQDVVAITVLIAAFPAVGLASSMTPGVFGWFFFFSVAWVPSWSVGGGCGHEGFEAPAGVFEEVPASKGAVLARGGGHRSAGILPNPV